MLNMPVRTLLLHKNTYISQQTQSLSPQKFTYNVTSHAISTMTLTLLCLTDNGT